MFARLFEVLFAPKYPKSYTGRHRAPARFRPEVPAIPAQPAASMPQGGLAELA
jgi:hypothetical protein